MNIPPLPRKEPSWVPVLFSALVYPGSGQFIQRRRLSGWFFAIAGSVLMALLLNVMFRQAGAIWETYLAYLLGDGTLGELSAAAAPIGRPMLWLAVIHGANIIDVMLARRRSR